VAFKNSISNKLVARTVNYPELLKKLSNAEAGIFIMRLVADSSDPFEIMVYFSKDAPHNFTGYENNTFTASLRKARTVTDDNQKIAIYGQLATQLNKDLIILPLASMYNERLFIRENCTLNNLGPLGPRYYRLSQITCN
jgi:ABC-type oligopeptide transport system substrate-binding subunit